MLELHVNESRAAKPKEKSFVTISLIFYESSCNWNFSWIISYTNFFFVSAMWIWLSLRVYNKNTKDDGLRNIYFIGENKAARIFGALNDFMRSWLKKVRIINFQKCINIVNARLPDVKVEVQRILVSRVEKM